MAFLAMNLLVLLEVYDRISLKRDLEVAREIQKAMLPDGTWTGPDVEAFGLTQPANTVGGDFYDILPLPDGTVIIALGDVAGKASPAALLMALLPGHAANAGRPRAGAGRTGTAAQRPGDAVRAGSSRFITFFLASTTRRPARLRYINAGQTPPLLRRMNGTVERLETGGIALGMFEGSVYAEGRTALVPGDALVMYSDGITEAEAPDGTPFDEEGHRAHDRARAKLRSRPRSAGRFSTPSRRTASIHASATTSRCSC
jgi:phosphoserine phosphatase RsbU/P